MVQHARRRLCSVVYGCIKYQCSYYCKLNYRTLLCISEGNNVWSAQDNDSMNIWFDNLNNVVTLLIIAVLYLFFHMCEWPSTVSGIHMSVNHILDPTPYSLHLSQLTVQHNYIIKDSFYVRSTISPESPRSN